MNKDDRMNGVADPVLQTDFCLALLRQMRARDTYGLLDGLPAERVLDPFVLTPERRRELPLVGEPDARVVARIEAFHGALAALIELECGLAAVPLVHLTAEGFGTVIVTVGKLVVLNRSVRDAHRFGFPSLSAMKTEADKLLSVALGLIGTYGEVAGL